MNKQPLKNSIKELPCPICGTMNHVSQSNVRIKCGKCGTRLLAVRVKKNFTKDRRL